MAKVKCIGIFFDLEVNSNRKVGEQWEVDTDRANHLNKLGFVEIEQKIQESFKPTEDKSVKPSFKKK
jgi:hypothetical protein